MREQLYRGIGIEDGKWHYGDLLTYRVYPVIFDEDKEQHECNAKTVGQFTGLCDKNGKKIFEGDVVNKYNDCGWKFYKGQTKGFIEYRNGEFIIVSFSIAKMSDDEEHQDRYEDGFYDNDGANFTWKELEVIGTIHDEITKEVK